MQTRHESCSGQMFAVCGVIAALEQIFGGRPYGWDPITGIDVVFQDRQSTSHRDILAQIHPNNWPQNEHMTFRLWQKGDGWRVFEGTISRAAWIPKIGHLAFKADFNFVIEARMMSWERIIAKLSR